MSKLRRLKNIFLIVGLSTPLMSCVSLADKELYSDDIFELSELAIKAYKGARWDEAARMYQQITHKVPTDAYIWFRLANTYVQKGDFDQAIDAYRLSIERDADQPKSWFNLSTAYMLNAKLAMLESWEHLRTDDPARELIQQRVVALDRILNEALKPTRVHR